MRGGDHSYPGVLAVANVTKEKLQEIYFPATYLKLLTTFISCHLSYHVILRGNALLT